MFLRQIKFHSHLNHIIMSHFVLSGVYIGNSYIQKIRITNAIGDLRIFTLFLSGKPVK
jgi:hypothetical protein